MHGAYKTALSTTDWKLDKFLKACYSIFKKLPARRADYLRSNDLLDSHDGKDTSYLFPMKHCGHRWLENSRVISRVIEILPYLKTYIKHLNQTKKFPAKDDRFVTLKSMLFSQTLLPSLEFTRCIISDIEPFPTIFQTERPLAVFVYEKMKELVVAPMTRFIRPEILETHSSVKNLMKIDPTEKGNLLPSESVKVGFGAKKILSNLPTVQAPECLKFKQHALCFLIKIVEKIQERSPLKYSLSLYLSSLSPIQITSVSDEVLGKRFDKLLEHLDE